MNKIPPDYAPLAEARDHLRAIIQVIRIAVLMIILIALMSCVLI